MHFITRATPIDDIDGKRHKMELKSCHNYSTNLNHASGTKVITRNQATAAWFKNIATPLFHFWINIYGEVEYPIMYHIAMWKFLRYVIFAFFTCRYSNNSENLVCENSQPSIFIF